MTNSNKNPEFLLQKGIVGSTINIRQNNDYSDNIIQTCALCIECLLKFITRQLFPVSLQKLLEFRPRADGI